MEEALDLSFDRLLMMMMTAFVENRAVYYIMWKNIADMDVPQMTIRRMRIACWIPKATNTHSQYVTLIAFPQQQWLHERPSMLRYTYIACFVLCMLTLIVLMWRIG